MPTFNLLAFLDELDAELVETIAETARPMRRGGQLSDLIPDIARADRLRLATKVQRGERLGRPESDDERSARIRANSLEELTGITARKNITRRNAVTARKNVTRRTSRGARKSATVPPPNRSETRPTQVSRQRLTRARFCRRCKRLRETCRAIGEC